AAQGRSEIADRALHVGLRLVSRKKTEQCGEQHHAAAAACAGTVSTFTSDSRPSVTSVASSPQSAASDSHAPGIALLPVTWMGQRPILSESAPESGSQRRLVRPTKSVTM